MHTRLDNPSIYMPDQSPELTASEMPHIKAALPASITEIDNIKSSADAPRQSLDVDTLLHVRHVTLKQEKQTCWHLIMTIISCTITFFLIIFPFISNCTTLCHAVPVKIPLPNPRIQMHLDPPIFLRRSTQKPLLKWKFTKTALHSLAINCGRQTDTDSDFACTLNQPAESSHSPRQHRAET